MLFLKENPKNIIINYFNEDVHPLDVNLMMLKSTEVKVSSSCPVKDIGFLFSECYSLKSVDFNELKITKTNPQIEGLFRNCQSLESIDLSKLDTSNATLLSYMFEGCKSLKSVDLSNFDTSNVNSTIEMFKGCESLKTLDLSTFNTSNLESLSEMFYGCKNLETLNLSNFDLKTNHLHNTFYGCKKLKTIIMARCNYYNTIEPIEMVKPKKAEIVY